MTAAIKKSRNIDTMHNLQGNDNAASNPERQTDSRLLGKYIDRAMDRLSINERCVFVLKHHQHIPMQEIAQIMDISVGTVKSTLFRAVRKMRRELSFYRNKEMGGAA